jgi:hypothetical protein
MQIRLPRIPPALAGAISRLNDWMNVPVYRRGRIDIQRLDVFLALFGVVLAGYYWETGGWQSMIQGLGFYVFCIIVALLFRPSHS